MEDILKQINERLERIEEKLGTIECDCSKMSSHITFVERTYSAVRVPLHYIKTRVELMMGSSHPQKELPVIKNDDE